MATILKVWRHIKNPAPATPATDGNLLEEQSY